MKLFEWFVLIVVLIAVAIFIIVGRGVVEKRYNFGTYVSRTGPCTNQGDNCSIPGTQFINQYCVPDPVTRRGCLDANGFQTYAPIVETQTCTLQCRQSIWNIDVGDCVPVDGGGRQDVTYTCVPHDDTGISACTISGLVDLNGGKYQGLTPYPVGTVLHFDLGCIPPSSDSSSTQSKSTIYNPYPSFYDTYIYTPECVVSAEDSDSGDLVEGWLASPDATSPAPDRVTRLDASPPPGSIPRGIYNPQPDGSNQLIACRRWGDQPLMLIRTKNGPVVPIQTPNIVPTLGIFTNWNQPMDYRLLDLPLTWLSAPLKGCSQQDIELNTGVIFLLGARKRLSADRLLCNIGLLVSDHYWGWLKVTDTNMACWTQAQSRYRGFGLTSLRAEKFIVEFNGFNVRILTQTGDRVNLASQGYILGKSGLTIPLEGEAVILDQDFSLITRSDTSDQTCNYLLRNKAER